MPNMSILGVLACAIAVAGCAAQTSALRMDASHPADPRAPEAPMARFIPLGPDAFDRAIVDEPPARFPDRTTVPPNGGHAMPLHRHDGHGSGAAETLAPPSRDSSSIAPDPSDSAMYVCPMHPEVTDVKTSECPKCGMTLVQAKEKP